MKPLKLRTWIPSDPKAMKPHWRYYEVGNLAELDKTMKSWPSVSIEQFTGLLDKSGKEIYEGDIVRWMAFEPPVETIHDVQRKRVVKIFNEGYEGKKSSVYLEPQVSEVRYVGSGFEISEPDIWSLDTIDDLEIIGNIHENADLLNTRKD